MSVSLVDLIASPLVTETSSFHPSMPDLQLLHAEDGRPHDLHETYLFDVPIRPCLDSRSGKGGGGGGGGGGGSGGGGGDKSGFPTSLTLLSQVASEQGAPNPRRRRPIAGNGPRIPGVPDGRWVSHSAWLAASASDHGPSFARRSRTPLPSPPNSRHESKTSRGKRRPPVAAAQPPLRQRLQHCHGYNSGNVTTATYGKAPPGLATVAQQQQQQHQQQQHNLTILELMQQMNTLAVRA